MTPVKPRRNREEPDNPPSCVQARAELPTNDLARGRDERPFERVGERAPAGGDVALEPGQALGVLGRRQQVKRRDVAAADALEYVAWPGADRLAGAVDGRPPEPGVPQLLGGC